MPRAHEAPGGIYATGIIGKAHKIRKKEKSINHKKKKLLNHFSSWPKNAFDSVKKVCG